MLCPCRLQIFAATLSFQAAAQPSLAHITSQHWPNILQIFYTAEYLHISVITACTRGRGCLGAGMGVFVRRKWAASGAGTLAVGNFAILEVVTDFERKVLILQSFMLDIFRPI